LSKENNILRDDIIYTKCAIKLLIMLV